MTLDELTGRQKIVLSRFIDLYRPDSEPIHTSTMVEQMGLRPVFSCFFV